MWKNAMGWFTSRGSKMTDSSNPNWECELIAKLAHDALIEQRRRRRWGIFFKLLTFAYVTFLLAVMVDWSSRADFAAGKKHTAMVELNGIIAPGADASAERVTLALQAAFKDKNTQGVVMRINSPAAARCRRRPSTTRCGGSPRNIPTSRPTPASRTSAP